MTHTISQSPPSSENGDRPARKYPGIAAIALITLSLLLLPCGVINHGDGAARYAQCKAMLRGSLAIPSDLAIDRDGQIIGGILPGHDGRLYSKYGIGTSVIWLLPTAIAALASKITHIDGDVLAGFFISFVNPIVVVLTGLSLRRILDWLCPTSRTAVQSVLLLYIFGASTLSYANTAFSEPLVGLLLLWACVLPFSSPKYGRSLLSGLAVSGLVLVKPELILLVGCVSLLFIFKEWKPLVAFTATASIGILGILAMNFFCRGSPLRFSYGDESSQFVSPISGLRGYFLSVNKNIVIFNTGLLFAAAGLFVRPPSNIWRRLRWTILAIWMVYVPFYASWWAWEGGMCFGPRFFQSFLPVTLLFAAVPVIRWERTHRWALFGTLILLVAPSLPLQIAGLEVKNEQAVHVSEFTGRPEPFIDLQLLTLKLHRGIRAAEIYRRDDFEDLNGDSSDEPLDFTKKRTFQYLNNWPLIALSNYLKHTDIVQKR